MKKYFFTGFAILLPIALTFLILVYLINLLTTPFLGIAEAILISLHASFQYNQTTLVVLSRICVMIILLIITFILGFLGQKFFFSFLLKKLDKLLSRIPIVKSIYRTSYDVTKSIFKGSGKYFKKTVLVPFPSKDSKVLGLLSDKVPQSIQAHSQDGTLYSIFVPTSPHPISGFLVLMSEKEFKEVEMSTEHVIKFLLSCGAYKDDKEPPST